MPTRYPVVPLERPSQRVQIILNGESTPLADDCSIARLVADLGLDGRRIAVEVNGDIVPSAAHDQRMLVDDDRVEIVHAIGGGQPLPTTFRKPSWQTPQPR